MFGHQLSCAIAHMVFEIPGCPAVGKSWYNEITPLLKGRSSMTTSQSLYQKRSPIFFRGKVFTHFVKRYCCCSWQAFALSSMGDSIAALANRWGGRTVTLVLSWVPLSKSGHLDRASALLDVLWMCISWKLVS